MVEIAFAIFFLMVIVLPLLFARRVHRPSDRRAQRHRTHYPTRE